MIEKIYQINTAALVASPVLTDEWLDCLVDHINSVGQYYVLRLLRTGDKRIISPQYVMPKYIRELKANPYDKPAREAAQSIIDKAFGVQQ